MSRVLVTGASGFVGSWLTRRLLEEGHEVSVLLRKPDDTLKGSIKVLLGDITDPQSLNAAIAKQNAVFHLAGLISYDRKDLALMQKVNVQGTENVLRASIQHQVQRFIHMSSVTAIGAGFTPDQVLNEDSPYNLGPLHLGYFDTKREAELLVKDAALKQQLDTVIVNPSTIYGAGDAQKGSRGTQLKVAQGQMRAYPPGGTSIVAIEDVMDAMMKVWQKGRTGERYILSGENLLLKDVFAIIAKTAKVPPPSIAVPRFVFPILRVLDQGLSRIGLKGPISEETTWTAVLYHWFDSSKAKKELDFQPRPAHQALEASVHWMQEKGLLR